MQNFEVKNKKDSFAQQLIKLILSGQLRPGDRLSPERELAAQYNISRGSVNQAILDLERMGFLHIVPRKGNFVADYMCKGTPDTLAAVMSYDSDMVDSALFADLMQFRILVERECTRLAAKNVNSAFIAGLNARTEAIFNADNDVASAVYEFHRYIVESSGNMAYSMVFRSFEKMLRSMILLHHSNRWESNRSITLYAEIAAAVNKGNVDEAGRLMTELLDQASLYLNRILREREGKSKNG